MAKIIVIGASSKTAVVTVAIWYSIRLYIWERSTTQKKDFFGYLTERWKSLFGIAYEVMLGKAYSLVSINYPDSNKQFQTRGFRFQLNKEKLRKARHYEGRYLLRSNLTAGDPTIPWQHYIQLTEIEQAFKELKSDLSLRPMHHQRDERIEAHVVVAFVAYCLQSTGDQKLPSATCFVSARTGLSLTAILPQYWPSLICDRGLADGCGQQVRVYGIPSYEVAGLAFDPHAPVGVYQIPVVGSLQNQTN